MSEQIEKCVIVLDEALPLGILANTATILGITLGKLRPDVVGDDVHDQSGGTHIGVITFPVPILKGNAPLIKEMRETLDQEVYQDVLTIDFSDLAQSCKNYEEYIEKMKHTPMEQLQYFGILLCGPKKKVNKLTGSMPLLR